MSWSRTLVDPLLERYHPTEHAVAALDPARGRLYVGSSAGSLWSLDGSTGAPHWRFRATGGIGGEAVVDTRDGGRVFVGADDGFVYALRRTDGRLAWRSLVRAPVRRRPIVTSDAVYVVTGGDSVFALDRRTGQRLWSYRREAPEGFTIAEHAGLAFADGRLYTGFADGTTVALDASDGSLLWERDASLDLETTDDESLPQLADIDTTPAVSGESIFVASFSAGVYQLNARNGNIEHRWPDLTGVVGLAVSGRRLVVSSSDRGVGVIDLESREPTWWCRVERGSPGQPVVLDGVAFVGETRGSMIALDVASGQELGRLDAGWGFSAPVAIAAERAFVVSNGGTLIALALSRAPQPAR